MKALVTGGGGFLGLYIVEQLVARGDSVRVLCRGSYPQLDALGVETIHGDLRDRDVVSIACQHVDTVFHCAAVPGVWGPWNRYYSINTLGTFHVIEACQKSDVERLIYTSSPSVVYDGNDHFNADESLPYPTSWLCHYPHSKALAEQAVLDANGSLGFHAVSLRPHLIWGPRDNHLLPRLIEKSKSGRLRRVGDGTNHISMSYVENAAAAHLQAADALAPGSKCAGRAYFINEPSPVNLWNWVDELLTLAGLPPLEKHISRSAAHRIGHAFELLYGLLRITSEPPMTRFVASQLAGTHSYSIQRAHDDFGYTPIVDAAESIRRTEPYLRQLAQDLS